jgi:hypothetical protein
MTGSRAAVRSERTQRAASERQALSGRIETNLEDERGIKRREESRGERNQEERGIKRRGERRG